MYAYTMKPMQNGMAIQRDFPGKRPMYVIKQRGTAFTWGYDYLYARQFSEKTARKLLEYLEERGPKEGQA